MELFIKAGHIEPSVIIFDVFGTLVKIEERRSPYRKLTLLCSNRTINRVIRHLK